MQNDKPDLLKSIQQDLQLLAELSKGIENRLLDVSLNDKASYPNLKIWTNQLNRRIEAAIFATSSFLLLLTNGCFPMDYKAYKSSVQAESFNLESSLTTYLKQTSDCAVPLNFSVKPRENPFG